MGKKHRTFLSVGQPQKGRDVKASCYNAYYHGLLRADRKERLNSGF